MKETTFIELVFKYPLITSYIIGTILIAIAVTMLSSLGYGILTLGIGSIIGGVAKFIENI